MEKCNENGIKNLVHVFDFFLKKKGGNNKNVYENCYSIWRSDNSRTMK